MAAALQNRASIGDFFTDSQDDANEGVGQAPRLSHTLAPAVTELGE
jgi:hypothetical protein